MTPPVEFLDADAEPAAPGRPTRSGRPTMVAVLALAAGLAGALVVARQTNGTGAPAAPASPLPSRSYVARPIETPVTIEPLPPLGRPVPALRLVRTPTCPSPGCSVLEWVADATLHALDTAFPGAVVTVQMSAFGPGEYGAAHPLLAREVVALAGRAQVVIDVVQRPDSNLGRDLVSTKDTTVAVAQHGRVTSARATVPGYRIVVRVTGGGRDVAHRLDVLLSDPGLMAVR